MPPDLLAGLALDATDPLYVEPARRTAAIVDEWRAAAEGIPEEIRDPVRVDLAPDALHKVNVSGGAPYAVVLPFAGADPPFVDRALDLPFVDYLRVCFQFGGFPGLRYSDDARVAGFVADLTARIASF